MIKKLIAVLIIVVGFFFSALLIGAMLWWIFAGQHAYYPHRPKRMVVISIDGLKPDYVFRADKYNLKIPNLRKLVTEGTSASGVRGVVPTMTFPSHTTLFTGVSPAKHGIMANYRFDPFLNKKSQRWQAQHIRVPALWDEAAKLGLTTASVDIPANFGANITYNLPGDEKLLREATELLGAYPHKDWSTQADQRRFLFNEFIIREKKPKIHFCYFSGLDSEQHVSGPNSKEAFSALETIDALVGQVISAVKEDNRDVIVAVVSDHGFAESFCEININCALRQANLFEIDEKYRLASWRAYAWIAGGMAAIMINEGEGDQTKDAVRDVLRELANQSEGIHKIFEGPEIDALEGFSGAAFVVSLRPGYNFGHSWWPSIIDNQPGEGGAHGYLPDFEEMNAAFFVAGPDIPSGLSLGKIDMRDIAPTLAGLLGISMPSAEGRNLLPTAHKR